MIIEKIIKNLNDFKIKTLKNSAAPLSEQPIPYPELTEEYCHKKIEKAHKTYMYGYGLSFQDDREFKAFQEGKLVM